MALFLILLKILVASGLSVSPSFIEIQNEPGQSSSYSITVFNSSTQPLPIELSIGDFWYKKEERIFPKANTSPFSSASWLHLSEKKIVLPPKSQKEVSFTFTVPPQAPSSAFSTVFVENMPEQKSQIGFSLRIAVPILYKKPNVTAQNVVLKKLQIQKPSQFKPLKAQFALFNQDPLYYFPKGSLMVFNEKSKELIAKEEIKPDRIILPQQNLSFDVTVHSALKKGKYQAVLSLFYDDKSIVKEFNFIMP